MSTQLLRLLQLLYISRNVVDLERSVAFYCDRLGFRRAGSTYLFDPEMTALLGLKGRRLNATRLKFGEEEIELVEVGADVRPYPPDSTAADLWFQHFALRCRDIEAAHRRLYRADSNSPLPLAISRNMAGMAVPTVPIVPIVLPAGSGGATAFKFRDPDGHPLELIQMATPLPGEALAMDGIDHSAIVVADVQRSIDFYTKTLGMRMGARQINSGVAQQALDGLAADAVAAVDVVALIPANIAHPHLELLGYRSPAGRSLTPPALPCDLASDRLVFETKNLLDIDKALLLDPDRHFLMLIEKD